MPQILFCFVFVSFVCLLLLLLSASISCVDGADITKSHIMS